MPSPARVKFGSRYAEYDTLLRLCCSERSHLKTRQRHAARDKALLRSALMMLCSHVEGYFEDLVCDIVAIYDLGSVPLEVLPVELRAQQVVGDGSTWKHTDRMMRWSALQGWRGHPLIADVGIKPAGCMDADLHTDGFATPGSGEVAALFKSLGFADIWADVKAIEADQIFRQSLDAMVARRNQIAHGKADAVITLADARLYGSRMDRLATLFDQAAETRVSRQLTVASCWNLLP